MMKVSNERHLEGPLEGSCTPIAVQRPRGAHVAACPNRYAASQHCWTQWTEIWKVVPMQAIFASL